MVPKSPVFLIRQETLSSNYLRRKQLHSISYVLMLRMMLPDSVASKNLSMVCVLNYSYTEYQQKNRRSD
jgi:hypothetical protein